MRSPPSNLSCISSEGLLKADCIELPIHRVAVPRSVGEQNRQIQELELKLGVLLGVMELDGESAIVSVIGPADRLLVAQRGVESATKDSCTFLNHWPQISPTEYVLFDRVKPFNIGGSVGS